MILKVSDWIEPFGRFAVIDEEPRQIEHPGHPADDRDDVKRLEPIVCHVEVPLVRCPAPTDASETAAPRVRCGVSGTMPCPRLKMCGRPRTAPGCGRCPGRAARRRPPAPADRDCPGWQFRRAASGAHAPDRGSSRAPARRRCRPRRTDAGCAPPPRTNTIILRVRPGRLEARRRSGGSDRATAGRTRPAARPTRSSRRSAPPRRPHRSGGSDRRSRPPPAGR